MQCSKFIPDVVEKQLINAINKDEKYHQMSHIMYIKLEDSENFIKKYINYGFTIKNNEYRTFFLSSGPYCTTSLEQFIKDYVNEITTIKPCKVCFKIINSPLDLCRRCDTNKATDLSIFEQNCAICQDVIKQHAKIMKCCSKLIHIHCFKVYKFKRLASICTCCHDEEENVIQCPYCRGDPH